ncbi:bifunctional phosphoribosylaminoimidazolecarboxamide formyltransferase/IMP cyclohydrolase [Roseovarius atlanticus]|uniref:bifunctional phosphoribosylaminoimidazolecarboxamide formyltransferase/IMP cyclohydrolase n=1 Tax=Roseovarius atlanticus TaxID=1641875 RepID=UPI001C98AE58|nr:bifunctional phosphoribosylaminoimidazolecarboxamide formyltransferase/IMP cyclohydrolase [Roseovarius atlanticus]MBY5987017.1 bifunctional phosphoribosylaminoimidazolecarboxamide formyltransferase/IMP cyclohydrolase [Roseovarius atlanticus]MBY6125657.1 bifunctional phosphoribosylaminoimidazolecarboxamide formyltransferase/IMP cyclohydrolase [Roseovarius atlanticus]MBY6149882.1 bifunctional phosphoribosylaminoimidazolecarboxamide formyltransferase/IMP cyclohydrolase [Roseovarius atlanticus]
MTDLAPVRRALLSVSDKTGLIDLGRALAQRGVELLSTGGSARALREAGLDVRDVAEVTGFPEMMDGRVKTLHPMVHGGLLALRDNDDHLASMDEHGIGPIDLLVVNLYPFEETVAKGADYDTCIENIDIGGPAMIRAAAKNHAFVNVVVDVEDYEPLLSELDAHDGQTTYAFRQKLALNAYARTGAYDAAVSGWMAGALNEAAPRRRAVAGQLAQTLRYGENPHQGAAFYTDGSARPGVATARQVQGKELSYNNINDTDAAFELVSEFAAADGPACAIIKHANPCGVARAETLKEAYMRAFDCDRTSAFGGIIALNQPLDGATAEEIAGIFTEVVIAPGADDDARAVFAAKKNLRLLVTDGLADPAEAALMLKQVSGGYLVQDKDSGQVSADDLRVVTKRAPSDREMADMLFAWKVAKHVKSNAIVYVRDGATVGVGAGQMSRVDSCRIAARKSQDMAAELGLSAPLTEGSVVASDAFFPFPDGLLTAAEAGATAVIQPGGSMRDDEVIAAADEAGLAMVLTGMRHFRH